MSNSNDLDKLKDDVEKLVKDFKGIFGGLIGNVKETVQETVEEKKEELGGHLHKIKDKIKEEASKPGTIQYVGAAFVIGLIVGAMMSKKRDE